MSKQSSGAVIHRNVALIACDTPGTLAETMKRLADLKLDMVTLGERHLVLPARDVTRALARLREAGQFPRLLGDPVFEHVSEPAEPGTPTENG